VITTTTTTVAKRWTAAELRRLPAHEREVVLQAAAEQAEAEYRTNPELTAFEALGKDEFGRADHGLEVFVCGLSVVR
jgi:hypothetical protein